MKYDQNIKNKLDNDLEQHMFELFWLALSQFHSADDTSAFFTDLLSETEKMMLAKRFMIALLLERGKTIIEVSGILHVAFSIIISVNLWRKRATPATRKVLESMKNLQNIEFFSIKLMQYLINFHRSGGQTGIKREKKNGNANKCVR